MIHRRDKLRAEVSLINQVNSLKNVEILLESVVESLKGNNILSAIGVENKEKITKELEVSGVFVAIGQMPANNIFESIVKKDEAGYALADENCKTQIEGLFVAGDCRAKKYASLPLL